MKKVLIIEDDTALRENTAELLELSNYEVITAANGKIGIKMAEKHLPDVIVCDIMMPEVDGYGVLESLSVNDTTAQIPFIFLSAKTERSEVRKGMNMGADDYLTKPFQEEELITTIESRLAKTELLKKKFSIIDEVIKPVEDELRDLNELKNFFDDNGEIINYEKGEHIYAEGEASNKIYLILRGIVKTHKLDESGKELITALYRPDDFLGFTSFIDNIPYQESASALEGIELAAISKNELKTILTENRKVSLELMNVLTDNLTEIKQQLLQMAYSSVKRKTALTIIQFAEILNKKPSEAIKISRTDLASVAGIAPESLIRTLSEFKKQGLIEILGRDIKITNLKALSNVL